MAEASASRCEIVLVGGAYMLLHELRESTHDVDTVTRLSAQLEGAVTRVARAEGLPKAWLNDRAAAFAPVGLSRSDCTEILREGLLVVLEPPARAILLMKVNALRSRGQDLTDAKALWPLSGYSTTSELLAAYFEAYPVEDPDADPYLLPWLAAQLGAPE